MEQKLSRKETIFQTLKYGLVAASAGIIEVAAFALLSSVVFHDGDNDYGISYFIALALSVLWNFTINRKYTFHSAANVPKAMLLVLVYYLAFTPLSIWWGVALTRGQSEFIGYLVLAGTMLVNFVTEFLYQRFVVFRGSINTDKAAQARRAASAVPEDPPEEP